MTAKHCEKRVFEWLLTGKTLTHNQAQRMFKTNRLAEYVRRLRKKDLAIPCRMVYTNKESYGVYHLRRRLRYNVEVIERVKKSFTTKP